MLLSTVATVYDLLHVSAFSPQMSTMPGLPTRPCFYDIDLDPITEEITGLFWERSSNKMFPEVLLDIKGLIKFESVLFT